jgi:transposase
MQGEKLDQEDLFFYGSLDSLVPQDDPYRRLNSLLSLAWLRTETRHLYASTGRPSVDPVVIAKLLLIAYLQGITSERELMRQVQVNLSYRRFLHYRLSEALPDHSNLTRSRQRLGEKTIRRGAGGRRTGVCGLYLRPGERQPLISKAASGRGGSGALHAPTLPPQSG